MNTEKKKSLFLLLVCFLVLFVFNTITPYNGDDFDYKLVFGTGRVVSSFSDVVESQVTHYLTHGGRSVAHTLAQIFLLLPKWVYNIAASLVYTLFMYIIMRLMQEKKEWNAKLLFLVLIISWFGFGVWGETFLWLIGACNYLWTTLFVVSLVLLCQQNHQYEGWRKYALPVFAFFLAIIAGWSNENTSVALSAMLISYILFFAKVRKEKVAPYLYTALVGAVIGLLILLLAPGNYTRLDEIALHGYEKINFFVTVICRGLIYTGVVLYTNMPIFILIFIGLKRSKHSLSLFQDTFLGVYLIGIFFTTYSMVLSPQFPPRAVVFDTVLLMLVLHLLWKDKPFMFTKRNLSIMLCVWSISLVLAFIGDVKMYRDTQLCFRTIEEQRDKGIRDVVLPVNPSAWGIENHCELSPFSKLYGDTHNWKNEAQAKYFGVDTISVKEEGAK